jgi:hypothetical protein
MNHNEVENKEFKLPGADDTLFRQFNEDYRHNAIIRSGVSRFFLFSDSYKTAAVKLFEQLDGTAFSANTLVYPIVFLCRHFIELRMKELISGINYSLLEKYTFPDGHNLDALWNTYKSLIHRAGKSFVPNKKLLSNTEELIKEFNLVDPNSMCFRYPVDKSVDRNPSLTITNLDLENFRLTMEKLFNFFDTQSDIIFHLIDVAEEYFSEIRNLYHQEMISYYYG